MISKIVGRLAESNFIADTISLVTGKTRTQIKFKLRKFAESMNEANKSGISKQHRKLRETFFKEEQRRLDKERKEINWQELANQIKVIINENKKREKQYGQSHEEIDFNSLLDNAFEKPMTPEKIVKSAPQITKNEEETLQRIDKWLDSTNNPDQASILLAWARAYVGYGCKENPTTEVDWLREKINTLFFDRLEKDEIFYESPEFKRTMYSILLSRLNQIRDKAIEEVNRSSKQ